MNRTKLKRLIHYVCSRCKDKPARLGAVKLNKVIWYVETNHYMKTNGHVLTGARFVKEKHGPTVAAMLPLLEELVNEGALEIRTAKVVDYYRTEYITKTEPDMSLFTPDDLKMTDQITNAVCSHTASSISDVTHTKSWKLAEIGEELPLYTVLAVPGKITEQDIKWADEKIALLEAGT